MTYFREFDEVDEFSASVIGQPGSRVFFLNARSGSERVTVRCEKQQVKAIATYLRHVLSDLPPPENRPMIPAGGDARDPADEPVFVLGPIGLGYDRRHDRLLVQLEELIDADLTTPDEDDDLGEDDDVESDVDPAGAEASEPDDDHDGDDDEPDRGHLRFFVTRSQADAFCERADVLVAAGRPQCSWCGHPIDPDGHPCPRMN